MIGYTQNASNVAMRAENTAHGTALAVVGKMTITRTELVENLTAHAQGYGGNRYQFRGGVVSGAATATFSGSTKPGSSSTNTWLVLNIDGGTFYLPIWT